MVISCEKRLRPVTCKTANDTWYQDEVNRWEEEPKRRLIPVLLSFEWQIQDRTLEANAKFIPRQDGIYENLESFLKDYPPSHNKWKALSTRVKSYSRSQGIYKRRCYTFAHYGLYFTRDGTTCFHCGGSHANWRGDDDPVVEHSRWFPECTFIRFVVGDDVVNYISSEHQKHMKELEERGRSEVKAADRAAVEALLDGEDIRFCETVGIAVEVLYLVGSSLKCGATKNDLEECMDEWCRLKLDVDWRTIPGNKGGSYPTLLDLKNVHVADGNLKNDGQAYGEPSQGLLAAGAPNGLDYLHGSKHPTYADFSKRVDTFHGFPFPRMANFGREDLAGAGLLYTKRGDETMCFHCGQKLAYWEPTDNPYTEHEKWHPSCEYIQWKLSEMRSARSSSPLAMGTNEPIEEAFHENDRESGYSSLAAGSSMQSAVAVDDASVTERRPFDCTSYVCGLHSSDPVHGEANGNGANKYTVFHSKPLFHQFATLASRESSFNSYPITAKGNTGRMAKAGFFYSGSEDRATCFQCGNALCNWDEDDDPLLEHARWYPNCPYVVLQLGEEAIKNVRQTHSNILVERCDTERSKSDQLTEMILQNLLSATLVRRLHSQGIDPVIMELAIRARLNSTGLVDVLNEQDLRGALAEVVSLPENARTREVRKADTGDLSKCIICGTGERRTIFLPCSHLVSCTGCAASCFVCPSCDRKIATKREVFLA